MNDGGAFFGGLIFGLAVGFLVGLGVFTDTSSIRQLKVTAKAYAVSTMGGDAEKAAARVEFDKAVAEYVQQVKEGAK